MLKELLTKTAGFEQIMHCACTTENTTSISIRYEILYYLWHKILTQMCIKSHIDISNR